jgi:hypothetical protein
VRAGQILGIELLDHVIVASGRYWSFKERERCRASAERRAPPPQRACEQATRDEERARIDESEASPEGAGVGPQRIECVEPACQTGRFSPHSTGLPHARESPFHRLLVRSERGHAPWGAPGSPGCRSPREAELSKLPVGGFRLTRSRGTRGREREQLRVATRAIAVTVTGRISSAS